MADELISLEMAIEKTEAFCDAFVTHWTDEKVIAWIKQLPSVDAVEVVRCEYCKWCVDKDEATRCGHCDCPNRDVFARDTEAFEAVSFDDFCSYGERKEDNAR